MECSIHVLTRFDPWTLTPFWCHLLVYKEGFIPSHLVKKMQCLGDKEDIGSSPFPTKTSLPTSPQAVSGALGSLNLENQDICTGRLSYVPPKRFRSLQCENSMGLFMESLHGPKRPLGIVAKKILESQGQNSNLGNDRLKETAPLTGNSFGPPPSPEIYLPSNPMCVYVIIGNFNFNYRTFCAIASDYAATPAIIRSTYVFWGVTGTGKSREAWSLGGMEAYCKDPRSKFWCGYRDQRTVIIDEFRGGIDISHLLRWTDRYPVQVEVKGSSRPLLADVIYITSNLHPNDWYPDIDRATNDALMRRLNIREFT